MGVAGRIMIEGKSPAQVVADLGARGIVISERTLREKARALGACRILGNAMILLPEHIDQIFEEPKCSSHTSGEASTGFADDLRTVTSTSERALEHLTKLSLGQRSGSSKRKPGNVVSLDPTRQRQKTR